MKEKVKLLKDVPAWTAYFFTDDFPFDEEAVTKTLRAPGAGERLHQLAAHLENVAPESWDAATLEGAFKTLAAEAGVKTAVFIHPARVAASGRRWDRASTTCSPSWAKTRCSPACARPEKDR